MDKYLGIDWGEKRIGLAVAEPETNLALPLVTVASLSEVLEIIRAEEITALVLGVPVKMSDPHYELNPAFLKFADSLTTQTQLPVHQIDERLTSLAADALGGSAKTKAGRDEVAATLILQTYLDKQQA